MGHSAVQSSKESLESLLGEEGSKDRGVEEGKKKIDLESGKVESTIGGL